MYLLGVLAAVLLLSVGCDNPPEVEARGPDLAGDASIEPSPVCEGRFNQLICSGSERMRCDESGQLSPEPCPDDLPCLIVDDYSQYPFEPPTVRYFCAQDVDECAQGFDNCTNELATCVNEPAGFRCQCASGYEGSGVDPSGCYDVDECQAPRFPCGFDNECVNTVGSYECRCDSGYVGTGTTACVDIDECTQDVCGGGAQCLNLEGSFLCTCDPTYVPNGSYFANPRGCHQRGWGTARAVSNEQGDARRPLLAMSNASYGAAPDYQKALMWEQLDGTRARLWISQDRDGFDTAEDPQPSHARLFDTGGTGDAIAGAIALSQGRVFAAWTQLEGSHYQAWARSAWFDGQLSSSSEGLADASEVRISVTRWDATRAVWQVGSGPDGAIWAARDNFGTMPVRLGTGAGPVLSEVDGQGHARVLYTQGSPPTIVSRKFHNSPQDGWLAEEVVTDQTSGEAPDIALAYDGSGMVTWRAPEPDGLPMARFTTTRSIYNFGTIVPIDDRRALSAPKVAAAPGRAVAVWVGEQQVVRANTFSLQPGWDIAPRDIDGHGDGTISYLSVALDDRGDGMALWVRTSAGLSTLWAAHYVNGSWQERLAIGTSTLADPMVHMAMNSEGRAGVVWVDQAPGSVSRIWFRPFE